MKSLKALSVKLPWAWLMFYADPPKNVENRDWHTNRLGTHAIHCSKIVDPHEIWQAQQLINEKGLGIQMPSAEEMRANFAGKIIGLVDIVDCIAGPDDFREYPWYVGPYGFVLKTPRPLKEPVEARGALGFWDVKPEQLTLINEQIGG